MLLLAQIILLHFFSNFQTQIITTKQKASIKVQESKKEVLNFCANNYLGLADHPELIQAAKDVCVFFDPTGNFYSKLEVMITCFSKSTDHGRSLNFFLF